MRTSDWIIESLKRAAGVSTLFGVSGANIEDLFNSSVAGGVRTVLAKHEHGAGTMADGYARASGRLGVVLATSGGGALNLVPSLGEAHASRVPVLALVGQPPTASRGRGAFQETSGEAGTFDIERVFAPLAKFSAQASDARAVPDLLRQALAAAMAHPRGPAVLFLPKDVQTAELDAPWPAAETPTPETLAEPALPPAEGRVALILGEEIWKQGLAAPARALAENLGAQVVVTAEGRGGFDEGHPQFAGVTGVMGQAESRAHLADADAIWVLGTRLGGMERYGIEGVLARKPVYDIGPEPSFLRGENVRHVPTPSLAAFFAAALAKPPVSRPAASAPAPAPTGGPPAPEAAGPLTLRNLAAALQPMLGAPGIQLVIDAGNAVAALTTGLQLGPDARWMIALGMGGMGYAFGASIGAALATDRPVAVFAGDGAFFMHGLEMHTAVELDLPICFILADNRGHGMCETREELFFDRATGLNRFRETGFAAGLSKLFPSLPVFQAATVAEVRNAAAAIPLIPGPRALVLRLPPGEMPPFAPFQDLLKSKVKSP